MGDGPLVPLFFINLPNQRGALQALKLRGREQISKSYAFDVTVAGPTIDVDTIEKSLVGQAAHLRFGREGDTDRWVHGVVRWMEADGRASEGDDQHVYRLRIVPTLRLLGEKKNSRVFQDLAVPDIVESVLRAGGVSLRWEIRRKYKTRYYCVQHQETDLRFVERLLAEEGIYYFFDQPADASASEIMVLADEATACKPVTPSAAFRLTHREGMATDNSRDLTAFSLRRRVLPGSVLLKAFDFTRPSFDVHGSTNGASSKGSEPGLLEQVVSEVEKTVADKTSTNTDGDAILEPTGKLEPDSIEHYHHDYGELEIEQADDAGAAVRRSQLRAKLWVGVGASRAPQLLPGYNIDIAEAQIDKHPGSYTVFEVEHEADNPRMSLGGHVAMYRNRFRCVPAGTPFRPRPPRDRLRQVLETATVVGPAGQDIYTDEHGRIKVQFHWDRLGKRNAQSSCWIRVMQPWAGAGWGFQFIPRVGMEVMVMFLAGDLDRPMVVGAVNNAEHPPPFPLPAHKTRSGIRTASTPGRGGYNEIAFEDKAGEEGIAVRAEKHLTEFVGVDRTAKIGNDNRVTIGGHFDTTVGAAMSLAVKADKHELIKGNRSDSTTGNVSVQVGGNWREIVRGQRSTELLGSAKLQFKSSASVKVTKQASLTALGGLSVNVGTDSAVNGTLHATGNWTIGADEDILLTTPKSISLQCGDSVVRLTPDKIEIAGKEIALKGETKTTVRGDKGLLELAGEAKLAAPAVRHFGNGGSLELTSNAYLKGAAIKLNFREGDPPQATDETANQPTRTLKLKLSDGGFNVYKNRPYEMTVDGVRYTGTTDGGGNVNQDIPESATKAHILVWEGDPPTGKNHVWDLSIEDPPAASSVDGARSRLANLGYEVGTGASVDPVTKQAILDFQSDNDLEETGELDSATSAKLSEVHGH
ncbi:MAG: type VI secretion system tip protein TssI/VgrG [Polyangiaceae bacterium]